MKKLTFLLLLPLLFGCQDQAPVSEFTGNQTTYELTAGSAYAISGTITMKERKDGFTTVSIALKGTEGLTKHPVHLHIGSISTPDAEVAALLSPVDASSGTSETLLKELANETPLRYVDLVTLEACIKIHLSDTGDGRNVVLAGGNIGASFTKNLSSGRTSMASCKSE